MAMPPGTSGRRTIRQSPPPEWAPWMLLGTALLWGAGGLIVRGAPLAGPQLAFWRSLAGAAAYQTVLTVQGRRPSWAGLRTAALGGAGFGLSLVLQFIAYKSTSLVSANVIFAIQPLLLALFAHLSHGDRHGRSAIIATVVAVAGTVIVIGGTKSSGAWSIHGDVAALAGVVVGCLYPIGIKHARKLMSSLEFQAASLWVSTLVTLPAAASTGPGLAFPGARAWLWIACLVAVGGTGHLLFTSAQHHVSVVASSSITLLEIVVVACGASVFFSQRITVGEVAGMVIVAAAIGWWVARE